MEDQVILTERTLLGIYFLFYCVLCADGDQTVRLQQVEASDLTLPGITGVQRDAQIQWFYRSEKKQEKILNSQVFRGETFTDISERFKDRLQLDRSSGALTIMNISSNDSGFYTLLVTTDHPLQKTFSVTVYAPVSVPEIINKKKLQRSGPSSESCSPVCFVKNGQDVTLTWYKENEIISNRSITNETHLSVSLNLSPEIQPSSNIRYICVSANPVSNQTASLNIREFCCQKQEPSDNLQTWIGLSVGLLLLILLFGVGIWFWRKQKKQKDTVTVNEVNYAPVKIKTPNGFRVNENLRKDDSRVTYTDTEDAPVVYSEVKRSI